MNIQTKLFAAGAACSALALIPLPAFARAFLIVLGLVINGFGFWRSVTHPEEAKRF